MKLKINNYEIETKDLVTLFPPSKYIINQRKTGVSVITNYDPKSYIPYQNYLKRFWAVLYNTKYMIIYDDPDFTTNNLLQKAVKHAFKHGTTVFFRTRDNCNSGFTPVYTELTKENNIFHSRPGKVYDYIGSYYTDTEYITKFPKVKETGKLKLKKFITYYELTYPETELDWYLAYTQIKYYLENKIPTAYDKNLYYRCPECGELVRRGTEDEHICYCEVAPMRVHMDYVVNGEE